MASGTDAPEVANQDMTFNVIDLTNDEDDGTSHSSRSLVSDADSSLARDLASTGDGTLDRVIRRQSGQDKRRPVAAIFVHAGAGYHSVQNEKIHLKACSDATRTGMAFLKAGASAVDAVEAAIRVLEDTEITNSGFGSNLSMDGIVECDATVVDHQGRSGACGAVSMIKNPISLAKLILEKSNQPLSLRRVPPTMLVGDGAKRFASEHGIPLTRHEMLVSRNARDRYERWADDLRRAEMKPAPDRIDSCEYGNEPQTPTVSSKTMDQASSGERREHIAAIMTATWNEGQADSPARTPGEQCSPLCSTPTYARSPTPRLSPTKSQSPKTDRSSGFTNIIHTPFQVVSPSKSVTPESSENDPSLRSDSSFSANLSRGCSPAGHVDHDNATAVNADFGVSQNEGLSQAEQSGHPASVPWETQTKEDLITDTVGAIAIDLKGNIAAGSSSGGIGMKHSSRIGPAALVGVGTAVIPQAEDDSEVTSVAAVTSGTGEHMATTMAAYKCADRLYHGRRRGRGGRDEEEWDEDAIMESFVAEDFMGHPGVRDQSSRGAIGVMAVRQCRTGYYLYFAHNTDSFALASQASTEREPLCVMSRIGEAGSVARGARKISVPN